MQNELESTVSSILTKAEPSMFTDVDITLIAYLIRKGIENKDLRCTGVFKREFVEYLRKQGYTEEAVGQSLEKLEVFLSYQWEKDNIEGKKVFTKRYYPTGTIRSIGYKYLNLHPEIAEVKK